MIEYNEKHENIELEQTLLGGVLINNDVILMLEGLIPEHFAEPLHQRIYGSMLKRYSSGQGADFLSLRAEFDKDEALIETGGGKYLAKLAGAAAQSIYPADLSAEIKQLYARRKLAEYCLNAIGLMGVSNDSPEEIAAELSSKLESLTHETSRKVLLNSQEVTHSILEDLKNDVRPFDTGLPRLNGAMGGGLYPGKAYGFAARKKVGKTILAATLSHNLSQNNVKHLFICAEMGAKEIHQRILSRQTDCYESDFRNIGKRPWNFIERIESAVKKDNGSLLYWDAPGLTLDSMKQQLAIAVHKHRIKGFILDYWQLVGGKGKGQSEAGHLDEVAQWIANFCRKHQVWAVVMAQINQEGNTRGGEGMRLAFDQVYAIKGMGDKEDVSFPGRWLQMLDTRYTEWNNIGSPSMDGLYLETRGLYFHDLSPKQEAHGTPECHNRRMYERDRNQTHQENPLRLRI